MSDLADLRFRDIPDAADFTVRQSGSIGQEIVNADGTTICWTTDPWMAQVIPTSIQQRPQERRYVVRTEKGATTCDCPPKVPGSEDREYERFPSEIVRPDEALTEEDVAELEQLAELVGKSDLCSRLFPLLIRSYQDHTGHEPAGAVMRIAARIEEIDRMGLHCAPQVVARVLREYIKASGR